MYVLSEPHPNVAVLTFSGVLTADQWDDYANMYTNLISRKTRLTIVFDLRNITLDFSNIIDFIIKKKELLRVLKPKTCRVLLAAVVVTAYDMVAQVVTNILKATGQVSLFYVFSDSEEAGKTVGRLVKVIQDRKVEPLHDRKICWKDANCGHVTSLLIAFFLRIAKHFLILNT